MAIATSRASPPSQLIEFRPRLDSPFCEISCQPATQWFRISSQVMPARSTEPTTIAVTNKYIGTFIQLDKHNTRQGINPIGPSYLRKTARRRRAVFGQILGRFFLW